MAKKPVENKALWESLLKLRDHFNSPSAGGLKLVKVDGHSGHLYNDRCDELAVLTALDKNPKLFNGSNIEYEKYLKQNPPSSPKKIDTKKGNTYSYVSLVDGKVYADKDWATCEKRVKGKKAKFKKVFSKEEETDLIQNYTLASLL